MRVSKEELIAVLAQFNPWWRDEAIADLPKWRRAAFRELDTWLNNPPAPRAVLLSGARQIGKTTLLLQAAESLLRARVPAQTFFTRRSIILSASAIGAGKKLAKSISSPK